MKTPVTTVAGVFLEFCIIACSRTASLDGKTGVLGPVPFSGVSNISSLLLDEASGILYLGARDTILALNASTLTSTHTQITWNVPEEQRKICETKGKSEADCRNYILVLEFVSEGQIYACGTYAFDPQCTFIRTADFSLEMEDDGSVRVETGKGKCPFDPKYTHTTVTADGTLYSATTSNFMGTTPIISRATGRERVRTEESLSWLSAPEFVSSAVVQLSQDSSAGDDDEIFFFFTEVAEEYNFYSKIKVPRVARVCKGDVGGMKTLQKRWTSFLKAGLVCEDRERGERYNILRAVHTLEHQPGKPHSTHFYSIHSSTWDSVSAVCVYSLADILEVLKGPFKQKKSCESSSNPETLLRPRPGQCISAALKAEGFESSLSLPDDVLFFLRDHPLMENSVVAVPLMVRRGITYTKIAATLMSVSNDNPAAILHLGTDTGELHRVSVGGQSATLLQEIPLFHTPVNNILLHQDQVIVSSGVSVACLPAGGCGLYPSCELCALTKRHGCVWREGVCTPITSRGPEAEGPEEPQWVCESAEARCSPDVQVLQVRAGLQILLPCVQVSPRPCFWTHPPGRSTRLQHWDLVVMVTTETVGSYSCYCQEDRAGQEGRAQCLRAAYQLVLEDPSTGSSVGAPQPRRFVGLYLACLFLGLLFVALPFARLRAQSPAPRHLTQKEGRAS
ncbi:semaphorin-4F-like isoform X1 [Anguilla rostrata]|uniref:semaphorin-4F-like isoform X1 n=1 Tax=Anguilla rostrata TaxID=7938 RepID=UPI0030CD4595